LAAAKALYRHSSLSAREIAEEALKIAAEVDLYTSGQVTVLTLGEA
jgi:ATP-dependent HslUV protease subunit HslV